MAREYQRGSVSIFSVIFATLLLGIVTIGFIKLMVIDQQQATTNDLSQSAYDAALAGVEDAKRVVRACQSGDRPGVCEQLAKPDDCRIIQRSGVVGTSGASTHKETLVVSSSVNGRQYDQAYTCVNIAMDTDDYLYEAKEGKSQVIPLQSRQAFDVIKIDWFTRKNIQGLAGIRPPGGVPPGGQLKLHRKSDWGYAAPALLRTQIIPLVNESSFKISEISDTAKTAFLYPQVLNTAGTNPPQTSINDPRPSGDDGYIPPGDAEKGLIGVVCSGAFPYGGYSCSASIRVGDVGPGGKVLLHLTPLYNNADVRVSLLRGDQPVRLYGIQPSVDVTGRAGNVFRRVDARLQLGDDFAYPEYALKLKNNLCKSFSVTDSSVVASGCSFD